MPNIESHRRVLDTFTGPVERPVLSWIAIHTPAWITPDTMTSIGVFGALITFIGYCLTNLNHNFLWLATFGFVVNWFGDSLDGTLARHRNIERPHYGFYIDHAVDAFNEILFFLGLGLSPFVRFDLACLALIGYLLLSILVYLRTCVKGEFTISYGKLGPTEARLIAIAANTLVFFLGNPKYKFFSLNLSIYDWVATIIILLLAIICSSTTYIQSRILSRIDPRK
jgi:archaetidylinositol phosphate synthase